MAPGAIKNRSNFENLKFGNISKGLRAMEMRKPAQNKQDSEPYSAKQPDYNIAAQVSLIRLLYFLA